MRIKIEELLKKIKPKKKLPCIIAVVLMIIIAGVLVFLNLNRHKTTDEENQMRVDVAEYLSGVEGLAGYYSDGASVTLFVDDTWKSMSNQEKKEYAVGINTNCTYIAYCAGTMSDGYCTMYVCDSEGKKCFLSINHIGKMILYSEPKNMSYFFKKRVQNDT